MLREPPYNVEAEQQVLGAILINNDVFYRVSDWLTEEHFYEPLHQTIYAGIKRLVMARRRATPVSLKADVAELRFGDVPGPAYLGHLAAGATSPALGLDFARTVYDLGIRRKIIEAAEDLIEKAAAAPIETKPDDLIEETEVVLSGLAERGKAQDRQKNSADVALEVVNMVAAAYQRDGGMAGLSTGLADLDRLTGGLAASDLIIGAGRPGMGKSALASGIAYHNAKLYAETRHNDPPEGCPVGFFTLEMSAAQIMLRQIAAAVEISSERLRRGKFEREDFDRITGEAETLANVPVYFDEAGGISIAQLAARARRMKRKHGIGLLLVDYLQLLSGASKNNRSYNRTNEVSEITTGLKALAKELEIPVLALSQLSREVEKREDKRPHLSDLRESGSIEQDADVVMFVFREEYYVAQRKPKPDTASYVEWENDLAKVKGKAEILIEKQRQGPTGTVEAHFNAALTKFSDLAHQERLPEMAL